MKQGRRQFCEDRRRAFRAVWAAHQGGLEPLQLNELIGYVQFVRISRNLGRLRGEEKSPPPPGDPDPGSTIAAIRDSSLSADGLGVTISAVKDLANRTLISIDDDGVRLTPVGQRAGYLQGL